MNEEQNHQQESGPDAPVSKREDDHLDRWSTALEIINIAHNSPIEWSVRIGIFGKWGSGKTTVMRFVENMAKDKGMVVVRFNPWQYKTEHEMWLNFADEVYKVLREHRLSVPAESRIRAKIRVAQLSDKASGVAEVASSAAQTLGAPAMVQAGISGAKGVAGLFSVTFSKEDFKDISDALGGRRIIVLIDDLDRTEPSLVPRLLYGVHTLLDLKGFCFVLGFDPDVVGNALQSMHTGWDGLLFLEKIIDFPVWLPEPTENQLKRLLYAEKKRYCEWIPDDGLEQVFDKLPKNPRALKRFIRFLWRLKAEVKRHNKQELNLALLLAINIFKAKWPTASCHLFRSSVVCEKMVSFHWLERYRKSSGRSKEGDDGRDELRAAVMEALKRGDFKVVKEENDLMIEELIWVGGFAANATGDLVLYHSNLVESPHAFTWKEYEAFISEHSNKKAPAVIAAVKNRATEKGLNEDAVVREFFESACHKYQSLLELAANTNLGVDLKKTVKEADVHLKILKVLTLEKGFYDPHSPTLASEQFKLFLSIATKWAHFIEPKDYLPLRKQEEEVLMAFTKSITEVEACYEVVRRERFRSPLDKEEERGLKHKLSNILEVRAAEMIAGMPTKETCVTFFKPLDRHHGFLNILFDLDSALWKNVKLRKKFLANLKSGAKNQLAMENAIDIFYLLDGVLTGHLFVGDGVKEKLIATPERIRDFWEAIIAQPLQRRMAGSVLQTLDELEKVTGINNFRKPRWLSELEKNVKTSKDEQNADES